MDLGEKLNDPELIKLIKQATEHLDQRLAHERSFYETILNILIYLQTQKPPQYSSTTKAEPILQTQKIEKDAESLDYSTQDRILDIQQQHLQKLDKKGLVDIITKHYHQTRPTSLKIGGTVFEDNGYYSLEQAMTALNLKSSRFYTITSPKIHLLHKEGKRGNMKISGYEIIRYHLRSYGLKKMNQKEFSENFYISENIIQRLIDPNLGVLETTMKSGGKVLAIANAREFYDVIFPIKASERYKQVMTLLGKSVDEEQAYEITSQKRNKTYSKPSTRKPKPAIDSDLGTFSRPRAFPPQTSSVADTARNANVNQDYKPYSEVPLKVSIDYFLIKDSNMPDEDAFRIRSISAGMLSSTKEDFRLNPSDVDRLYLAKAYIPEREISKQFKDNLGEYDKESVLKSLELAGTPAILYNEVLVFPPGTLDIAMLTDAELQRIGALAKPLIEKNGPFITLRQISELIGNDFRMKEFPEKKKSQQIGFVDVDGVTKYNHFQVVKAYRIVFEKMLKT